MLQVKENNVRIEGLLSEINLEKKTFKRKTESGMVEDEAITGSISVKVYQQLPNGEDKVLEIPIHVFNAKTKRDGNPNPAYSSMENVMTNFKSIAAVGEEEADAVRITGGHIEMNEYYSRNEKLVRFPRISATFINKISKTELKPSATFSTIFVVDTADYEVDKDGVPTDKFKVRAIVPQWGGRVDVVDFYAANENVVNAIQSTWEHGQTVKGVGRLNFSQEERTFTKQVAFGEAEEERRTFSISELILTGGSEPMDGEFAYEGSEIQAALIERKTRLEALKVEAQKKATLANASKVVAAPSQKAGFDNLGF